MPHKRDPVSSSIQADFSSRIKELEKLEKRYNEIDFSEIKSQVISEFLDDVGYLFAPATPREALEEAEDAIKKLADWGENEANEADDNAKIIAELEDKNAELTKEIASLEEKVEKLQAELEKNDDTEIEVLRQIVDALSEDNEKLEAQLSAVSLNRLLE